MVTPGLFAAWENCERLRASDVELGHDLRAGKGKGAMYPNGPVRNTARTVILVRDAFGMKKTIGGET